MSEQEMQDFELQVRQTARGFVYPPVPPIQPIQPIGGMDKRTTVPLAFRLGLALIAALLILGAVVWAVPAARATLLRVLRIGVVEIIVPEPPRTPMPVVSAPRTSVRTVVATRTVTLMPQARSIADSLDLYGQTTLEKARSSGIRIKVPTALGEPDAVYLQDFGGKLAVLVWFEKPASNGVRISLQIFTRDIMAQKMPPQVLVETQVKRKPAAWVEGAHMLQIKNGNYDLVQLVSQHALIWTEGSDTYRLETDLPMAEAIKIADSTP